MAIRVSHTPYAAIGQLAKMAGQTKADIRKEERFGQLAKMAFQGAQAEQARQHEREMLQFRADLSLKTQQRAHLWELEKMETRSRNDFELSEMRYKMGKMQDIEREIKEREEYLAAKKTIEKADNITDKQKQQALLNLDLQYHGFKNLPVQKEESRDTLSPAQLKAAGKYITEMPEEPSKYKPWEWFREGPTETQKEIEDYLKGKIEQTVSPAVLREEPEIPSPFSEYPDAFLENGVWKVIRNGKKYRIEE